MVRGPVGGAASTWGSGPMALIRDATGEDVAEIRRIFVATYGEDYPYQQYYDLESLMRMVYAEDTILLVAVEEHTGAIVGTASVVMEVGAYADFVGEFGRLAVDPAARRQGIGKALMEGRLARSQERLRMALVEPRAVHTYSQIISERFGFAPVGFLPMKHSFGNRESVVLSVQYFGDTLKQRRNHPRVIPEVYPIADLALRACGLGSDAIVDASAACYPLESGFELETFDDQAYTTLLHIERGRVDRREIFGSMRLHYGLFKLRVSHATYLIARRGGTVAGAVGVTVDANERIARIFELISPDDRSVRFLLEQVVQRFDDEWGMEYVEVDVNAHEPRMQRTLFELGFRPCAYVPALVFDRVERLDAVRMVRLSIPINMASTSVTEAVVPLADAVVESFGGSYGKPEIVAAATGARLFAGMTSEQVDRLAAAMEVREFAEEEEIVAEGNQDETAFLLLNGTARVYMEGEPVGQVAAGECLGELALLTGEPHRATARASEGLTAAVLGHAQLVSLVRARPDIGVVLYRNLALDLREKLYRAGRNRGQD